MARYLVVDERPSQAAYTIPSALTQGEPTVAAFDRWIREHLAEPISIAGAAKAIGVSQRTLQASHAPARHTVTILHRSQRTGAGLGKSTRWVLLAALSRQGVSIMPSVSYRRIEPAGVRVVDAAGAERLVPADSVVIAAGQEPARAVATLADRSGVWYRAAGGARDAAGLDAVRAFAEGLAVARALAGGAAGVTGR